MKRDFPNSSSIARFEAPDHDVGVKISPRLLSSLLWALGNLVVALAAFLALYTVRFSGIGIEAIKFIFVGLLATVAFSIRDVLKRNTRWQGLLALLLCLPVLMFLGLLTVWEGPLYVSVSGSSSPEFQVDGASGLYSIQIYGPDHSKAEWQEDDIGLIWGFDWQKPSRFPPMRLRFVYGTLPTGYLQKAPLIGGPPKLDPEVTYAVVIQPAMGMPEYFALRGRSLTKADDEYASSVCWAPLSVPGRNDPAYVRADCETKRFLSMSERGQARLKAYREKRLAYY